MVGYISHEKLYYHLVMTNIAMENGKPSIFMGYLYHGYVSHNPQGILYIYMIMDVYINGSYIYK